MRTQGVTPTEREPRSEGNESMSMGYERAFALFCVLFGCGATDDLPAADVEIDVPCLAPTTALDPGSGDGACDGPGARYATRVVSACFGGGASFGRERFPEIVYGPPKGGGCCGGSLDVVSLGEGGSITLAFDDVIVDGPGVDFIVFENAFDVGHDPEVPYAEIATVEVSADGVTWTAFPCTATSFPYGGCAGWHPVLGNVEDGIDPLDPAVAGGDPYDLADIGAPAARFVRITDRADVPGSFDLDAVGIVNGKCR